MGTLLLCLLCMCLHHSNQIQGWQKKQSVCFCVCVCDWLFVGVSPYLNSATLHAITGTATCFGICANPNMILQVLFSESPGPGSPTARTPWIRSTLIRTHQTWVSRVTASTSSWSWPRSWTLSSKLCLPKGTRDLWCINSPHGFTQSKSIKGFH